MQLTSYASDLLEDAMNLAQVKALNSFSFRDLINTLTELWGYCYERIALIDSGYFSKVMRLTREKTTLPPFVKNTVNVFSARDLVGFSRKIFKQSGMNDLNAGMTYHVSGNDLYCRDVTLRTVWCEYVPEPSMVFFTKNNRDPRIIWKTGDTAHTDQTYTGQYITNTTNNNYGPFKLVISTAPTGTGTAWAISKNTTFILQRRIGNIVANQITLTNFIQRNNDPNGITDWVIRALILDFPYMFITYYSTLLTRYESYIVKNLQEYIDTSVMDNMSVYNAFDYTGRGTNIKFVRAKYNDYTGLGVTVIDYNSSSTVMELGWTPDTLMTYPSRIMYNYMVATLAQRFASMNGSTVMAVELALVQAEQEMGNWMKKNKSAWHRANNVNGPTLSDWIM